MSDVRLRSAFVGTTLMLALTGCGTTQSDATDRGGEPAAGSAGSEEPSVDRQEQITPGGIAAIVLHHLGSDAVRTFVTHEPEPGSVSVSVRLQDDTPHNFAVVVYSPEQAEMFGARGECPPEP